MRNSAPPQIKGSASKKSEIVSDSSSQFWEYFNRYFYSLCLFAMATGLPTGGSLEFSILGFSYYLLFIFHAVIYYAMRSKL